MHMELSDDVLLKTLQTTFGFQEFRSGQREAITTLLQTGRLLCIQPTGHGKSLLYQLPAVILPGITLVVSPLLALMRDQLHQLNHRFGIPAASINTDQSEDENYKARHDALHGRIRLLFIAPEQLEHMDKLNFLLKLSINLVVIDEAHCISTWGHDFRPSYRQIIKLTQELIKTNPHIKMLALTATANQQIENDIQQQLSIGNPQFKVHRESMNRPNIRLSVIRAEGMASKLITLNYLLQELPKNGLIYCATRENTQIVADYLNSQGFNAQAYHAGLDTQQKKQIQHQFMQTSDKIIAATNALGMGIDKQDLRFIIHFDFPGSITAYYQEVGRAGRDNLPAEGILLYDPTDNKIQQYFIESSQPSLSDFRYVLECLTAAKSANLALLKRQTGLHPTRLTVILAELVEQRFVEKRSVNGVMNYCSLNKKGNPDLMRYLNQLKARTSELNAIQRYAEKEEGCLMVTLRRALGDKETEPCLKCSTCTRLAFRYTSNPDQQITTVSWLERRTVPLTLNRKIKLVSPGLAVLDGKLRSPDFMQFMHERTTATKLSMSLLQLIRECLQDLMRHYRFCAMIALPSRTWQARNETLESLANFFKVPVFLNLLDWQQSPTARQGELLNNDQRQHNVTLRMRCNEKISLTHSPILLVDDYTGSGATLNEAARTLREDAKLKNEIVPFTIAAVKWRLGKPGMI